MKPATARGAEFRWPLILVVVLAVSTSGCLILPTPEYDTGSARDNINKQTPKQFEAGKTTHAEVMMALGEPDAVSPDESKLAYRSEKVCGLWFVGGGYSGTGGTITKDRYLVTEFDASGALVKAERTSTWFGTKYAATVLAEGTNGAVPALPADAVDADAHPAMMLRGSWFAGVDGYQGKGSAVWIGQTGRLLLYETRLEFFSNAQFANVGPVLTLPYDSLSEVRVEKFVLGRRLVIRTRAGEPHSFDIYGPKGAALDKSALQGAAGFLQARIQR